MILVPIEVAPRPSKTSTSSSTHGPIYTNTLHLPKEPPTAPTGASQQSKPTISNPYIHISECFSGKPVPPQPPPRGSSNGGNGSQFKTAPQKTSKTSTGSHRHDSSTDEEQVIINRCCEKSNIRKHGLACTGHPFLICFLEVTYLSKSIPFLFESK